jgi:hypothetical protein
MDLLGLLDRHRPLDQAERGHLQHIRTFVHRHADPFDREIQEGHLTGSAFILDPAGRLLLTHHRQLGIWIQLGGHASGEHRAAPIALREAEEESQLPDLSFHPWLLTVEGAPLLLDVDVHDIPARGAEPRHQHLDLRFLLRTGHPELIRQDPAESRALAWVTLAQAWRRCDAGIHRALRRLEALEQGTGQGEE